MNKEQLNSIYGQLITTNILDTPEGHIIATATLNAIRDCLKFHLNGKIEKATNEILNHNSFSKCEYFLGVNDTANELLIILDRMEI